MIHDPCVSIVMPVYNGEKYIGATLSSILNQSYSNFEVIVLNSLSTDSTMDIVHSFVNLDNRIKIINEKDNGIYDAMNRGITLSQGEWIFFMGCDDQFYDEFVLDRISLHFNDEVDVVYGDVIWVPDMINESGPVLIGNLLNRNVNHQRIFYSKHVFNRYGTYNCEYKIAADYDLNIRLYCNNEVSWKYVPIIVSRYFSGGFSSRFYDFVFWANWYKVILTPFRMFVPEKEIYRSLNRHYRSLLGYGLYWDALRFALIINLKVRSVGFLYLHIIQFINTRRLEKE
jgi:glycosyltransferase involved in cell wall biosynthesis